mmetsp:Transcript_12552/g.15451  ORF Transcript_12552/g.15451 Transcript_12552/m.15451 type:complete len:88 (+) Transcript_12552:90-353(+)
MFWGTIPLVWRNWWYEEIKEKFPTYYDQSISLLEPDAIFIDRTGDLKSWNDAIESKQLSSIANVYNRFLLPNLPVKQCQCQDNQHDG